MGCMQYHEQLARQDFPLFEFISYCRTSTRMDNNSTTAKNQTTSSSVALQPESEAQAHYKRSKTLQDTSNLQPFKRTCSETTKKITSWTAKRAPRGQSKSLNSNQVSTEGSKHKCNDDDHTTLQQILLHHKSTFCNGIKYSERNTGTEVLKAIANYIVQGQLRVHGAQGYLREHIKAADVTEAICF